MADRIQALFFNNGPLSVENNQARWTWRANQIEAAIIGESARWGDAREGQRITAYSSRSPLPNGTGAIPRGSQTVPLMTVDHWRDSVTYVNETFFPGATDIFLDRMRDDGLFPSLAAPAFVIDGQAQHGGNVLPGSQLSIEGNGDIYFTINGSDPRNVGGDVQGQLFETTLSLNNETTIKARARVNGQWSPLLTATFTTAGPKGDLNGDAIVDSQDIDALFAAIASEANDSQFDVNNDNSVDASDSDYLIETILNTRRGDFDLNGKVDFADFLTLSGNFGQQEAATWKQGDADGDGGISFADFLLLSTNFGFDNSDR